MTQREAQIFGYFLSGFVVLLILGVGSLGMLASGFSFTQVRSTEETAPENNTIVVDAPATLATTEPTVLGAQAEEVSFSADKLYSLINGYRREQKLTPLRAHVLLEQSAAAKLSDMRTRNYWTHRDPQGRDPWYFFTENGYFFDKAGENLSFGYTREWRVFEEWTKSPDHNAQLLTPEYEHMGLAVDCNSPSSGATATCIVVLHLGKQIL